MSSKGDVSFVEYISRREVDSCGYCKSNSGSKRHGMWAHQMTEEDYQTLIDRGWRRSGQYCYKPIMPESCCPMYTIRCDAKTFRPSKSQKRILKRVNRYLSTGDKGSKNISDRLADNRHSLEMTWIDDAMSHTANKGDSNLIKDVHPPEAVSVKPRPRKSISQEEPQVKQNEKGDNKKNDGRTTLKAKQIRINRKLEKLRKQGFNDEEIASRMVAKKKYPVVKTLEDYIDVVPPTNAAHRLEVKLVMSSPRSATFNETYKEGFKLFEHYQMAIHKDPPGKVTPNSYNRFLVKSPLQGSGRYGSYHHQYWLDGNLIGVGVIDILPHCVSSVYFFYDPDYSFLCLGTYSALREIHLVRSIMETYPDIAFYYMGYYIKSCPKMRYKGAFNPSFLLCPEAYTWHPISKCLPKFEISNYSRLNDDAGAKDNDGDFDIDNVQILRSQRCFRVGQLANVSKSGREMLEEYCHFVGKTCSESMILCVNADF